MVRVTSSLPIFSLRAGRVEPGPGSARVRAEPRESSQRLDPPLVPVVCTITILKHHTGTYFVD